MQYTAKKQIFALAALSLSRFMCEDVMAVIRDIR